jgi:GNAT superfamily N-acetyltransferase
MTTYALPHPTPGPSVASRTSTNPGGPLRRPGHVCVRLADGGVAHLRPLRAGEAAPLLEVFAGMSGAARADRYLAGLSRLPAPMLAALTNVDGCDHVAWLATVDGRPAGIARYLRTAPGTAEVAFEVVDVHHGRGVGSALLDAVLTTAVLHGIRRLQASVAPTNRRSQRMLRRLGLQLRDVGGLLEGEGPFRMLDPARVDREAVAALVRQSSEAQEPLTRPRRQPPCASQAAS